MTRFENAQWVVVNEVGHPLVGRSGVVVRLRRADDAAWVRMDDPIPSALARFLDGDPRRNDVMLYPDQCIEGDNL